MSPTGEQPIAKAEPALSLSFDRIVVLLGLFGSLAGAYAGYAVVKSDVERNSARITLCEAKIETQKDTTNAINTRLTVTESSFAEIKQGVKELNAKFDRLFNSGGTSNANYRPRPTP